MTIDNQAQANNTLQRLKRDLSDPFDYMAKAHKPNKIAKAQAKRQNVSSHKPK